jgi:hypothetical protein
LSINIINRISFYTYSGATMFKVTIHKTKKGQDYPAEITDGKRTEKVRISRESRLLKLGKWKNETKVIKITEVGSVGNHPSVGGNLKCIAVGKKAYSICNSSVFTLE